MLHIKDISKVYGERKLFMDFSAFINTNDRIGIVGANGSGKSTLLKIIAGFDEASSGEMYKSSDITIGYLPQEMDFLSEFTLFNEAAQCFKELADIEIAIDILHQKLSSEPDNESFLKKLGELEYKKDHLDAYTVNSKIEKILIGLGFKEKDFHRKVNEFSGGWKMRLLLAKILLIEPSILLLDEPTNHLDLNSLEWLEEYLNGFKGSIMLVSHDRAFLNNMTKRTFEISTGKITEYKGNYSFYVEESEKRRLMLISAFKNQQEKIKQTERFIERFRYKATKAKQVQSRIKQLEKIDYIEVENNEQSINFRFPSPMPSGRNVVTFENITKRYENTTVFSDLDLLIERGDKIAVVGPNGAGKSTLLRLLSSEEEPTIGKMVLGYNVDRSYFAQEQILELDPKKNVLETIEEIAIGDIRKRIRTLLGSFLFSDDDVFKAISVLSGGEKSRVALAKMLLTPSNFLIMDEPTNHLDMQSKEILQNALAEFEGTFIIASHDRDFLNPIINKVLEVSEDGVNIFQGNLTEYHYHKNLKQQEEEKISKSSNQSINFKKSVNIKEQKRFEAEIRQKKYELTKTTKTKIKKIENEISAIEDRNKEIERKLLDPEIYKDGEKVKELNQTYRENKNALEKKYSEWEKIQAELEEFESKFS
jgi:ATP-binding cassette, subfamily F, member 3